MENYIVEMLKDVNELWMLENAFLNAIGEASMDEAAQMRLVKAIRMEKIFFFIAKKNGLPIGMCSVSPCFTTFACKLCGVFDDFYVQPESQAGRCKAAGKCRASLVQRTRLCKHDCGLLTTGRGNVSFARV